GCRYRVEFRGKRRLRLRAGQNGLGRWDCGDRASKGLAAFRLHSRAAASTSGASAPTMSCARPAGTASTFSWTAPVGQGPHGSRGSPRYRVAVDLAPSAQLPFDAAYYCFQPVAITLEGVAQS